MADLCEGFAWFFHHLENHPQKTVLGYGGECWTWEHLARRLALARGVLRHWGMGPGQRAMVSGHNSLGWVLAKLACQWEGVGFVPVSHHLTVHEARHHLQLVSPTHWLVEAALLPLAHEAAATLATPPVVLGLEELVHQTGQGSGWPDVGLIPAAAEPGPTLLFTGGTTGLPKAVVRRGGSDHARALLMAEKFGLLSTDAHHLFAPLYHSGPNLFLNLCLVAGGVARLSQKFEAAVLLDQLAQTPGSVIFGVPTHYRRLCAALRDESQRRQVAENLKLAVCAGAPLSQALASEITGWLGPEKLWEFYGSTETGTVAVLSPQERALAPGSVGRPPHGTRVKVMDANGQELPVGSEGFLYVHNNTLMEGYFGDEAATAACRQGEFLTVWDIGRVDEKGYVYLCDRRNDLILSGGVNLYPAEIEAVIEQLPQVAHAAVVAQPHEDLGEVAVAVVQWRGEPLSLALLQAHLGQHLARHKHPRAWFSMTDMPLSPVGKVLRGQVKAWLAQNQPTPTR